MAKVFGRATIKAGGAILDSRKGATLDVGGVKRTTQTTANRVAGYSEEIMQAKVELTIPLTADVSLTDLQAQSDVTISFETDVGLTYSINHAFLLDPPQVGDQSGDVRLVYEGDPATEV